ncbi:hypothetical protein GQ42DRAFT_161255 [Ramicandelaber brevisporus]|nr:hypothetical protein GQ42DRAFT_161255 [Ramicandelaber brevisporus]
MTNDSLSAHPAASWDTVQVQAWFSHHGFYGYDRAIEEHGVTGEVLLQLDHDALTDLSMVSLGMRILVLRALHQLRNQYRGGSGGGGGGGGGGVTFGGGASNNSTFVPLIPDPDDITSAALIHTAVSAGIDMRNVGGSASQPTDPTATMPVSLENQMAMLEMQRELAALRSELSQLRDDVKSPPSRRAHPEKPIPQLATFASTNTVLQSTLQQPLTQSGPTGSGSSKRPAPILHIGGATSDSAVASPRLAAALSAQSSTVPQSPSDPRRRVPTAPEGQHSASNASPQHHSHAAHTQTHNHNHNHSHTPGGGGGGGGGPSTSSAVTPASAHYMGHVQASTAISSPRQPIAEVFTPPQLQHTPAGHTRTAGPHYNVPGGSSSSGNVSSQSTAQANSGASDESSPSGSSAAVAASLNAIRVYGDREIQKEGESYKTYRVGAGESCTAVLTNVLRRFKINDSPNNYVLCIVHNGKERVLKRDDKPLQMIDSMRKAGIVPVFTLKHIHTNTTITGPPQAPTPSSSAVDAGGNTSTRSTQQLQQ